MGLEAVELALARLYTDDRLRARFFAEPERVAVEIGLAPEDAERLLAVDRSRIELFAESLRIKRFGEVRRLVPRTLAAIGEEALRERFFEFARDFTPEGVHKHHADALAFAAHLTPSLDAARFDAAVLGLFHRLDGRSAVARTGPAVALVRLDGRRALLLRARRSARFRVVRLI